MIATRLILSHRDCSASASSSYHTKSFLSRFELDISQQRTWKAGSEYDGHQQALRNIPIRASLLKGEAQTTSVHQTNLSGNKPFPILHQYSSSNHSAGFGSREPLCSVMKNSYGVKFRSLQVSENLPHQQNLQHPTHDANMAAADALATTPATRRLPLAVQLTIFYADMVNVYEDVPYDKAQAIMLLASRESHSNYLNPLVSYGASAHPGVCSFGAMSQPRLRTSSPAPSACAGRPPPGDIPIAIRRTPTRTIELPQARKASLARFLERRRDRARTRPYAQRNEALRRIRDASPSPSLSTGRPPARPLSPPATENKNGESSNASGASTTDNEANSPPPIQPSQSMSEDNQMPRITQTPNVLPSPIAVLSECEAVVR